MAKTFKVETWKSHGVECAKMRMYDGEKLDASRGFHGDLAKDKEYVDALKVVMAKEYDEENMK